MKTTAGLREKTIKEVNMSFFVDYPVILRFAETPCFADLKTGLRWLHVVGYSILSIGFPCRINGRCKLDNMIQLWEYFHPAGAVKTRRDLKGPWIPSSKIANGGG